MPQAIGGFPFQGSCLVSSYWGIAISRVSFCPKLLWQCNFTSLVLCQAIVELQFAGFCFVSSYWGITTCRVLRCVQLVGCCFAPSFAGAISRLLSCVKLMRNCHLQDFALCQAFEEFRFVGYCLAPNYWGRAISRLLPCVVSSYRGNYHLQGFALRQAIGNHNVRGLAFRQAIG